LNHLSKVQLVDEGGWSGGNRLVGQERKGSGTKKQPFLWKYALHTRKGDDILLCGMLTTPPEEIYIVETFSVYSKLRKRATAREKKKRAKIKIVETVIVKNEM
jgi:hypothetical protein